MDLQNLRNEIDRIDKEMVSLFEERMRVCEDVARYKMDNALPVLDSGREKQKLQAVAEQLPEDLQEYGVSLYDLLMELSRSAQTRLTGSANALTAEIAKAIETTPPLFPPSAMVACQGVEGAYSQMACEKLFRRPHVMYFSNFEAVFSAIEKGLCRYGVIPLENSTAGSVNMVYDLMMRHNFRIVRSVRLKVDHNLLAKPGVKLEEIREVYSHEHAISQCSSFLQAHPEIKVVRCANTAEAAKFVAESDRRDMAALSSRACAELYHLQNLASSCQDQGNNYTRFICIARQLEIYPGADRTSLMLVLPHRPGSLYKLLSRFYALGINLNKLESRPLPDRDFEFMFYFDLDTSVYSPQFMQLMGELDSVCESFSYLGSYSEVI
ncbi:MAG: prephenate dehydratase [Ruminococcaceae bacterium]|nr:prephenate dehydratase [Oscillospiraceae bacterium]